MEMDGVEALLRLSLNPQGSGAATINRIAGKAISCVENAIAGEKYRASPNPARTTSLLLYCQRMKREVQNFEDLRDNMIARRRETNRNRGTLREMLLSVPPLPIN
ncbi:MAG TPA: hypothetical protein VGR45_12745 [Stellaceae bacterium]|nr:hypothetical protein [Stellaceae bacterium]